MEKWQNYIINRNISFDIFMIRFGIAGIPLTSKGRTFVESVEEVHNLGLNSLEVQLLRVNVQERPALDYAGLRPKDVQDSIIVNILRQDEEGNYKSVGVDTSIDENDIVQELFWNMARNYSEIKEGGDLAKELDVTLSLHAPYYMDLLNGNEMAERSSNHLRWSLIIARGMEARRVITHTGFYSQSKKESLDNAVKFYSQFSKEFSTDKGFPFIGVESSGKEEIFGSVSDLTSLAKKVPGIEPILNFAHVHALQGGSLIEVRDFESIIETFSKYKKDDLYTEFSGVEYEGHEEVKLSAIKHGDLKFETLSEVLADMTDDVTIISSSPLLEHDSQYMNIILLRTIAKKLQKKESKKSDVEVERVTRSYPVKKGVKIDVESILATTRKVTRSGTVSKDHVIAKIPGLERVELWGEGKMLMCETTTEKNSENYENAVKKFNELIEALTGYNAKERKKIMSKVPK